MTETSSKTELFNAPFKDYTIIAKDGQKIKVHKNVLWLESDMFKALASNKNMKRENFIQTTYDYDSIRSIVLWMYGFYVDFTYDMYDVASFFRFSKILDWNLYIHYDSTYIERFNKLEDGTEEPTVMEEDHYEEIYKKILDVIIHTHYGATVITNRVTRDFSSNDDYIYNLSIRMIKAWIKSRSRLDTETDMVVFLMKYMDRHPSKIREVNDKLIPLINMDYVDEDISLTNIDESKLRENPPPYIDILRTYDVIYDVKEEEVRTTLLKYASKHRYNITYESMKDMELYDKESIPDVFGDLIPISRFGDLVAENEFIDFKQLVDYV